MIASAIDGTALLDGATRRLDPRARLLWMLRRSAFWAVLGVIWMIAALANGSGSGALVALVVTGVVVAVAAGSAALSYRYWSWAAHADAIEITHGVVFRHLSVVPYHRIQQIDIDRGPLERVLSIATLVLRSAAATTDARLPGVAWSHSEALRHALLERAGVDDAV